MLQSNGRYNFARFCYSLGVGRIPFEMSLASRRCLNISRKAYIRNPKQMPITPHRMSIPTSWGTLSEPSSWDGSKVGVFFMSTSCYPWDLAGNQVQYALITDAVMDFSGNLFRAAYFQLSSSSPTHQIIIAHYHHMIRSVNTELAHRILLESPSSDGGGKVEKVDGGKPANGFTLAFTGSFLTRLDSQESRSSREGGWMLDGKINEFARVWKEINSAILAWNGESLRFHRPHSIEETVVAHDEG